MFKVVKKYQKSIMAVVAVLAMITFATSFGTTPDGGRGARNVVVGKIYGDEKVHLQELTDARRSWDRIKRTYLVIGDQPVPAYFRLAPLSFLRSRGVSIPQISIDKDADSFYALVKEAERLGLNPPDDDVQELIRNSVHPQQRPQDPGDAEDLRRALVALLKVEYAYQRALSVIKVSTPERQSDAARFGQELKVNFVEYNAEDFKKIVPAPSADQLTKQFDAFANSAVDQVVDDTNPFGFGYRYPNRVKLEFITLLREQLRAAAKANKDDATWELEARKQYLRNPDRYPTTKPSEDDVTPSLLKAPTTAPTTGPTTRPLAFDDYRKQILEEMISTEAATLGEQIRKRIVSTMEQDYGVWRNAVGAAATQPSTRPTGPASSVGVPYGSDQYLSAVAQQIQTDFKIFPVVMTLNKDWLSQKDLTGNIAGTPRLMVRHPMMPGRMMPGMTYAEYLTTFLDVLGHTPGPRDPAATLSIMQPTVPMSDEHQNTYIFRVTAADPAHKAAEMQPYAEQVVNDYRTAESLKLARAEADKLVAAAKKDGFDAAAKAASKKTQVSGTINQHSVDETDALKLKFESQRLLTKAAYDLLTDADAVKAGKTVGVVDLPRDGKVLVISLAEIKPTQPDRPAYQLEAMFARAKAMEAEDQFLEEWFNPKNIIQRTHLELDNKKPADGEVE